MDLNLAENLDRVGTQSRFRYLKFRKKSTPSIHSTTLLPPTTAKHYHYFDGIVQLSCSKQTTLVKL